MAWMFLGEGWFGPYKDLKLCHCTSEHKYNMKIRNWLYLLKISERILTLVIETAKT